MTPDITYPDDVADHFGFNRRRVRRLVRELGLGFKCGRVIALTQEDVDALCAHLKNKPATKPAALNTRNSSTKLSSGRSSYDEVVARLTKK